MSRNNKHITGKLLDYLYHQKYHKLNGTYFDYEENNQKVHFDGKLITHCLKTLWTNISISFARNHFENGLRWKRSKHYLIAFLNVALIISHRNEASGYFIHNQNICSNKHGTYLLRQRNSNIPQQVNKLEK